jgi:hypothetical protein
MLIIYFKLIGEEMNRMKKLFLLALIIASCNCFAQLNNKVQLIKNDAECEVDVLVDGKLFTSYLYTDKLPVLRKPVLYPIVAASGVTITRGFPLQPKSGERIDHPHHIGSWFNYGDVDGLDFWNNSDAIPAARAKEMGTIKHLKILNTKNGNGKGELSVSTKWMNSKDETLVNEKTHFTFFAKKGVRIIDRATTLSAKGKTVSFKDNKEGLIGMRVARELELPSKQPVVLSDSHGNKTEVPVMDNSNVTGNYLSSEGLTGADVWGKRARWVALSGTIKGSDVTIVIYDNPKNVGYPTYWHARDYGLFAANPLGQSIFSEGKETLNYKLAAGKSVTFKYRILILDSKADKEAIEKEYKNFVK